ncbi:hypothetical protein ACRE_080040 [Hapsidospora chrysogenum ATCC 11550]|uniref:Uncharacterized protein n=1 Tax=Hapsidospora chrysogenum (strain ATCC 11550 / CBS 779.69 / DSM 880 / IAM 14645 / JCM 23072 / IMI 49137) TaxID=857340 RepID=A0A086SW17_HAPC1|nr:hypothetical protein ACRE_080040 [Hapsidospora chrysogenum ATCC 11550]
MHELGFKNPGCPALVLCIVCKRTCGIAKAAERPDNFRRLRGNSQFIQHREARREMRNGAFLSMSALQASSATS